MSEQNRNILAIFRLNNAIIKEKNRKLAPYELTSIQEDVLLYIMRNEGEKEINQLDIQAEFKLTNPTVSGIIDRLEVKGFVKRIRSGYDARYRRLVPQEKALTLLDTLLESSNESEEEILQGMAVKERKEFARLIGVALRNAESAGPVPLSKHKQ
jgi:MarR family multiple gene transcriptional regulator MgrA